MQEAKLQLLSDKLATEKELVKAKRLLSDAKQEFPLNTPTISQLNDLVNSLKQGYEYLVELENELGFKE